METGAQHDHDPRGDIPPLPEPWRPRPEGDPGDARLGCGRPMLFGCGCLVVGLGALLLILPTQIDELTGWGVAMIERVIFSAAPNDLPAEERERLAAAFDALPAAMISGRLERDGLRELQSELNRALTKAQQGALETADVERLTRALERVVAAAAPAAPDDRSPGSEESPAVEEASGEVVA